MEGPPRIAVRFVKAHVIPRRLTISAASLEPLDNTNVSFVMLGFDAIDSADFVDERRRCQDQRIIHQPRQWPYFSVRLSKQGWRAALQEERRD